MRLVPSDSLKVMQRVADELEFSKRVVVAAKDERGWVGVRWMDGGWVVGPDQFTNLESCIFIATAINYLPSMMAELVLAREKAGVRVGGVCV